MTATNSNSSGAKLIDLRQLQVNQIAIVVLTAIAFILGGIAGVIIVAFTGVSLLVGAAWPGYGPFQLFNRYLLRPLGVEPKPEVGSPEPHRFAAIVGGTLLLISSILLLAGYETAGWVLALVVLTLALVNLVFGFCAGCFMYLQIGKFRSGQSA